MEKSDHKSPLKLWISVITLVLIAAIVVASRHEILQAWHLVLGIDWWILLIFVPLILLGNFGVGEMIFSYLKQKRAITRVGFWTRVRVSFELNFVNHILPSGGISGFSYMNWRLGKMGVSGGKATMAQVVRYATGFMATTVLLIVSVLLVTMDGMINRWLILMSSGLVFVMVVAVLLFMYLAGNVTRLRKFASWVARTLNKLVVRLTFGRKKRVITAVAIERFLGDVHDDYLSLMRDKKVLWQPFLWGVFFTAMDIAVFWVVFWALGSPVNPAPILIGYALASFTGFLIITPGGAGAYEAVMVMILGLAGMAQSEAIAGIVLARVLILLVTVSAGYFSYQDAVMRYGGAPK